MTIFSVRGYAVRSAILVLALIQPGIARPQTVDETGASERTTRNAPAAQPAASTTAAQLLQPDELESLSKRNEEPGAEVRGGSLSNEHLTYIVIALAAAVLVLVLK
ncbi:MAG: hypothetical protein ABL967_16905 [Bryobacteraceae bacterium]